MCKKRAKKYCKPTINDTCLSKINLVCTEYDGVLPVGSKYDEDECISGQDIIEDIIEILDDHTEQLDFSEFGCCIDYTPSDTESGLQLQDVLSKHENIICHLLENCCVDKDTTQKPEDCDDTCEDITVNHIGLVFNTTGVGNTLIDNSYANFTTITPYALNYKTKVKGVYKITLDIDYTGNFSSNEVFSVGISLDGQQPQTGAFIQDTVKVANNSVTMHFLIDTTHGVNIIPYFKKAPTILVTIEKVKLIIEKVK